MKKSSPQPARPNPTKRDHSVVAYQKRGPGRPRVFSSATEAAKVLVAEGVSKSFNAVRLQISNVLHGRRKTAYWYRWKRAVDVLNSEKEVAQ